MKASKFINTQMRIVMAAKINTCNSGAKPLNTVEAKKASPPLSALSVTITGCLVQTGVEIAA